MIRKNLKTAVIILACSILLELLVFNARALFSMSASEQHPEFTREGNTLIVTGMSGEPGYFYIGVESYTESGASVPVKITIAIQDEGNSSYYQLPQVTIYPLAEKSKYLRIHSYGEVEGMQITMETDTAAETAVTGLVYDARVPWFVSVPRLLLVFAGICLVWCLRPGSGIYVWEWKRWQKRMAVILLVLAGSGVFWFLVRSNPAFLHPIWPYHQQYHQLAVALIQGQVSIDAGNEEMLAALNALDNPYDYNMRMQNVPDAGTVWDTCYYQGKFYVYFGIVPVLVFYLPYYLLFHSAFPTWLGVFFSGVGILAGTFYLLAQIRKRWFPGMPYVWYLLLSFAGGNSMNLYCAMLHADFYYLPILMALCFTLWGMGLMVSSADCWEKKGKYVSGRLAAGGLCLALTAGCRPQFLVGSFLLIPLLGPLFFRKYKEKQALWYLLSLAAPYLVVAAGLMYYNAVRFGSVFDFGAAYNLTTNDMTRRGVSLGRLPDGIFMYLLQPVSFCLTFPFAEVTPFYSGYLGSTVKDWTFGGVFWTHPMLLVLPWLMSVKRELKQKKLYGFTLLSIGMAVVVVAADTQMAGILNRYCTDFLWLLVIPTVLILFQLVEKYRKTELFRLIVWFVLLAGASGIFYELAMAFRGSGLMNDNVHRYYMIKSLFQ